jgi:glycosyltransferase involved in cell wall biosynthesis
MSEVKFILFEPCNFVDHPVGGQLSFARLVLSLYKDEIATIGYTLDPAEPVGVWFEKSENGYVRQHYNLVCIGDAGGAYKVPRRLVFYRLVMKHRKSILKHPCRRLFVQEPSVLMALRKKDWDSICYCFPGVSSALKISRFKWAKHFSWIFDQLVFRAMHKTKVILAAADQEAIDEMVCRSGRYLKNREIRFFPTRVDMGIFRKRQPVSREGRSVVLVSSGRLHWAKGWDLILNSLALIKAKLDFQYIYIGDGPDREAFLDKVQELGLTDRVSLTGYASPEQVAEHLRSADLYLMGSIVEGWPTTLVEAYATGLPMVCTKVSGAGTIISEGRNGYICDSRDPEMYSAFILKALRLNPDSVLQAVDVGRYAIETLRKDLEKVWR